jgi:hypothetical protein
MIMAPIAEQELAGVQNDRAISVPEALNYTITRDADQILQFTPPVGSRKLADALSYHFPAQGTLESKMQAAILRYFKETAEPENSSVEETNARKLASSSINLDPILSTDVTGPYEEHLNAGESHQHLLEHEPGDFISTQPLHLRTTADGAASPTLPGPRIEPMVWNMKTGTVKPMKRKRKLPSEVKSTQVTKRGGNACDPHHRQKKKVGSNRLPSRFC